MTSERHEPGRVQITLAVAARRTGLSPWSIRRYIRRELVSEALTEAELARLRRIRRLTELGVNLAGIEVILQMRGRIEDLRDRVARLEAEARDRTRGNPAHGRTPPYREELVK